MSSVHFPRLGFTKETEPEKIEYDLMKALPKDHWIVYNIQIITFGREICTARAPSAVSVFCRISVNQRIRDRK